MDRYRRGVLKGIELALGSNYERRSKTDGLRAIRRFERENNCKFNYRNPTHADAVRGTAWRERIFKALNNIEKRDAKIQREIGKPIWTS